MSTTEIMFVYLLPAFITLFAVVLSLKSDLVKEGGKEKYYSLARVQLLWWTVIVLSCFSIKFGYSVVIPNLDQSVLYLLGIGTGTITVSKLMSDSKSRNPTEEYIRSTGKSGGLFFDILDDGSGISVHRFQAVLFNIIFGFTFLNQFFSTSSYLMPSFTNEQLALLGLSSSTYLFMKNSESKNKGIVAEEPVATEPMATEPELAVAAVEPVVAAAPIVAAPAKVSENPRAIVDIDDQEDDDDMETQG